MQPELKAKLSDKRYNIAMENHEFGVAPEAFTKWIVLNDTYDILSTSIDRYDFTPVVMQVLLQQTRFWQQRFCGGSQSILLTMSRKYA